MRVPQPEGGQRSAMWKEGVEAGGWRREVAGEAPAIGPYSRRP